MQMDCKFMWPSAQALVFSICCSTFVLQWQLISYWHRWDSQLRKSYGNSEFTDLPYSERALILSIYADGLSSHVTWCTCFGFINFLLVFFIVVTTHLLLIDVGFSTQKVTWQQWIHWFTLQSALFYFVCIRRWIVKPCDLLQRLWFITNYINK